MENVSTQALNFNYPSVFMLILLTFTSNSRFEITGANWLKLQFAYFLGKQGLCLERKRKLQMNVPFLC